jgi:hypothetical protein
MTRVLFACACLAVAGCEADDPQVSRPKPEIVDLALDVDIRSHADLRMTLRGDELEAELTVDAPFGVLPKDQWLRGKGRVEHFPEADMALYTARFSVPAVGGGPCQDQPVSLALALHRRGGAPRYSGSLTPYCGDDTWAGLPARQPLRLATSAPSAE